MTSRLQIRIRYWPDGEIRGWYVNYRQGRHWGRNHYASFVTCVACCLRVKLGYAPLASMRPYEKHL